MSEEVALLAVLVIWQSIRTVRRRRRAAHQAPRRIGRPAAEFKAAMDRCNWDEESPEYLAALQRFNQQTASMDRGAANSRSPQRRRDPEKEAERLKARLDREEWRMAVKAAFPRR